MDRIETATDIVSSSASRLCLDMRFLTRAVLSLRTTVVDGEGMPGCDGSTVVFHAETVLRSFREDPNSVTRDLAHCVLHRILGHDSPDNGPSTDLAEDMLVEYVLDCLDTPHTSVPGRDDRMFVCERLFAKAGAPAVDLLSATVEGTSKWQLDLHRRMFRNPKPPSRKMPLPKRNQLKWIRQFRSRMPQFRRKPCLKSPRRRSRCQIKMLLQRSHLRVRLKRTRFRKRSP